MGGHYKLGGWKTTEWIKRGVGITGVRFIYFFDPNRRYSCYPKFFILDHILLCTFGSILQVSFSRLRNVYLVERTSSHPESCVFATAWILFSNYYAFFSFLYLFCLKLSINKALIFRLLFILLLLMIWILMVECPTAVTLRKRDFDEFHCSDYLKVFGLKMLLLCSYFLWNILAC